MNHFIQGLRQYFDFSGRATRTQYWMFVLFANLISGAIWVACFTGEQVFVYLYYCVALALLCPLLSAAVRRLRDAGKSPFSIFFALIPLVGPFILLYFLCLPSKEQRG